MHETTRAKLSGWLLIFGALTFWAAWALMPLPGTNDAAFILQAVAGSRPHVWLSCVIQLVSAAAWAAGLVLLPEALLPAAPTRRARLAWWGGACLLAVGMTASSADAIYHLAAYELTHPDVPAAVALPVMARFQGPDLLLLLPGVGALFAGLGLFVLAAVMRGIVPRAALLPFAIVAAAAASRVALPGSTAPRVASLVALAGAMAPIAWIGWSLATRGRTARVADA